MSASEYHTGGIELRILYHNPIGGGFSIMIVRLIRWYRGTRKKTLVDSQMLYGKCFIMSLFTGREKDEAEKVKRLTRY